MCEAFDEEDPISSAASSAVPNAVVLDQPLEDSMDEDGPDSAREAGHTDGDNAAIIATSEVEAEWLRC